MLNPITEEVVAKIFLEVFETGYKGLWTSIKWFSKKGKEHDFFGIAAKAYAKRLDDRYNTIRVLGMDKPVPLRDLFVRVNILEKITAQQRVPIEELEEQFEIEQRSFGTKIKTVAGKSVADELEKFIVLGKPGAGKTTFLKFLTLQSLDGQTKRKRIPVFIGLKDFADSGITLFDFIVEQFDICNFPDAKPFLLRVLEKGKCQLLLDGLDEVSVERRDFTINQVRDFSDKYSYNQFILSCRIGAYNYWFDKFTAVEMADFNDEQIRAFIHNWFKAEPEIAKGCWNKINENKRIKELGSTPILLTMICLAFNESLEFPQNRAELYQEALDVLLKKWDSTRRIKRDEIYKHLSAKRKVSMFSKIAAETFENDKYFWPKRTLENRILEFIKHLPEAKDETLEPDSEAVLNAIEAQHGIFVERAQGIYSFSHLTFHEYFTARYIVDNAKKGTLERLVGSYLFDDKWREVFLLTVGMLDEADEFLIQIKTKIEESVKAKQLVEFLKAMQLIIKRESPYPVNVSRALAIIYLISFVRGHNTVFFPSVPSDHTISYGFELANALDSTLDIIETFKLAKSRMLGSAHAVARGRIRDLKLNCTLDCARALNYTTESARYYALDRIPDRDQVYDLDTIIAFELTHDLSPLFHGDITGLEFFLKANKLLVDCLNTECYISNSTRKKILDELLIFL